MTSKETAFESEGLTVPKVSTAGSSKFCNKSALDSWAKIGDFSTQQSLKKKAWERKTASGLTEATGVAEVLAHIRAEFSPFKSDFTKLIKFCQSVKSETASASSTRVDIIEDLFFLITSNTEADLLTLRWILARAMKVGTKWFDTKWGVGSTQRAKEHASKIGLHWSSVKISALGQLLSSSDVESFVQ